MAVWDAVAHHGDALLSGVVSATIVVREAMHDNNEDL
jgi:hypothetical protein